MSSQMELTPTQKNFFEENGFLILNQFIPDQTCIELMNRMNFLIQEFNPSEIKTIFSTKTQTHAKNMYFLDSGDKIRFFFEEEAIDDEGQLKYDKMLCINKIGHALHTLDPIFRNFSYSPKINALITSLSITNPYLIQSMYICKQPFIGGEVTCHQDSTYLYVKDQPVTGFWFALEDATLENGCLWAIPGGHKTPLKSRMRRNPNNQVSVDTYDNTPWPIEKMIPLEVPRGSLIVLHGLLPHMSKENSSAKSRHAYTLHVISEDYEYAKDNWLQHKNK